MASLRVVSSSGWILRTMAINGGVVYFNGKAERITRDWRRNRSLPLPCIYVYVSTFFPWDSVWVVIHEPRFGFGFGFGLSELSTVCLIGSLVIFIFFTFAFYFIFPKYIRSLFSVLFLFICFDLLYYVILSNVANLSS